MQWDQDTGTLDVRIVAVQGVSLPTLITSRACWLLGWTITNLDDTDAAQLALYDGQSDTGTLAASLYVPALSGLVLHPSTPGFPCPSGVFLDIVTGAVTAALVIGEVLAT